MVESVIARILYEFGIGFIGGSRYIYHLVRVGILNPRAFVEGFVVETEFDFPDGLLMVDGDGLAPECESVIVEILIGLFVLFDVVEELFRVLVIGYFLRVEELSLFPTAEL